MPVTFAEESVASHSGSGKAAPATTTVRRSSAERPMRGLKQIDPNRRYLSCQIAHGKAFVDFVNPRAGDSISVAVSFLKDRFHTQQV